MISPLSAPEHRWWYAVELPVVDYEPIWRLQCELVAAKAAAAIDRNVVLFLEHTPVITVGRRGGMDNLSVSRDFLHQKHIQVFQAERGGDITYHGPGQLVVYPIVDLRASGLKVVDFVAGLEEVMIRTAGEWGISAKRNPINRGIWVSNRKLGSIGIAVRRGITFHGLALNVNLSLEPFSWIQPCGLTGVSMTSVQREAGTDVEIGEACRAVQRHFTTVFNVGLALLALDGLEELLHEPPSQ